MVVKHVSHRHPATHQLLMLVVGHQVFVQVFVDRRSRLMLSIDRVLGRDRLTEDKTWLIRASRLLPVVGGMTQFVGLFGLGGAHVAEGVLLIGLDGSELVGGGRVLSFSYANMVFLFDFMLLELVSPAWLSDGIGTEYSLTVVKLIA